MNARAVGEKIDTWLSGDPAVLRVIVGVLDVIQRRSQGERLPIRRAFELIVDVRSDATAAHVAQRAHQIRIEPARLDQIEQRAPRIGAGDNRAGTELLTTIER